MVLPIVLLIFFSSNGPQEKLMESLLSPPTPQPEKGFVENGKSPGVPLGQVNDLTTIDFKFPDDHSKRTVASDKKIFREKILPDEKTEKDKTAVPLYSLVKNDCGEGYALDENGVCQKTITVRNGKKFDSDRRRKRQILDYDWINQSKKKVTEDAAKKGFREMSVLCNKLYSWMVPDGYGSCKKIKILDRPFDKTLPP